MMIAWGTAKLSKNLRYRRAVLGSAAVAILAALLVTAYIQTGYWKNSISLWAHTLACTSDNWLAHNNFGAALATQGNLNEAIENFERAIQLKPDYADAYYNFGSAMANQENWPEAIKHYTRTIQLKPDYINAHYNLGIVLDIQGKTAEATPHFQQALNLATDQKNTALAESIRTRLKSYPTALPQSETR